MIAFKVGDTWLDLPPDLSVQIEFLNPIFELDRIPGTMVFPFNLPETQVNQLKLKFPGELSVRRNGRMLFNCGMYIKDQLWRVGKLNILKKLKNREYSVNFQTDVGDISAALKDTSLQDIDLGINGANPVDAIYPEANYVLFPVYNPGFFADQNPDFSGYVNYYYNGEWKLHLPKYSAVPFPYLVFVLRKVLDHFGYQVQGDWLEEEEVRRLVIYNTRALEEVNLQPNFAFSFNKHVPDIKANEFLKALRAFFGLGFIFNSTSKVVRIVKLREIIQDNGYTDWTRYAGPEYEWEPNQTNGFKLVQGQDPDDELYKARDTSWTIHQVGEGAEEMNLQIGTLPMVLNTDTDLPSDGSAARQWLIPEANQKGCTEAFGLGTNKFSLRLLSYRGMQPDSRALNYPMGSSDIYNIHGQIVGAASLQLSGPNGLYEKRLKEWVGFLSETEKVESEITFDIGTLLSLKPERKSLIQFERGTIKGLWEKISITVNNKTGIQEAQVPLFKTSY